VRKEDKVGCLPSVPGRGALAALLLLAGCLNPRPEELPSSADPAQPTGVAEPGPNVDDPSARASDPGGGDGTADINASGAAPADEEDQPNPAFAPEAPPAPGGGAPPPEPADAGADAAADPDAG
jgi:hypothetical protein